MNQKTKFVDLLDLIASLDNVAQIAALRAICNSTISRCIGAIRQHLRLQEQLVRQDEAEARQGDLDQRNQLDENTRAAETEIGIVGFAPSMPPMQLASIYHALFDWAYTELRTLTQRLWDQPMTPEQMIDFMIERSQTLDPVVAQAIADAAQTDVETIKRMHELQDRQDRERLKEARDEILATFNGFGANGYAGAFADLPAIEKHQLGVKLVEALTKAKDQTLLRVMRSRRISDLGSIPLLEEGITKVTEWVNTFEHEHSDEITDAVNAGRNLRTLEDVATL